MEGFHLPHRQTSLRENRIFHHKVPFPLHFIITVVSTFQSTLILLYKLEEDPTVDQISQQNVQYFLCLVAAIVKSSVFRKNMNNTQSTTKLINKLFNKNVIRRKKFIT